MHISNSCLLRFVLLGFSLILLSACGLPGPGSSTSPQDQNNNNPLTAYEDVVHVRIQGTDEMLASWQNDLFKLVTPEKAYALSGLNEYNNLGNNAISVITLDANFSDRGRIAEHFAVRKNNSGQGYDILFQQTLEKQLNRVIRVRLPNDEVMYGPLYSVVSGANIVIVNVASHYVISKLYDAITSSAQLQDLLSCRQGEIERDTNCAHQSRAKVKHIVNLIELVHNYDLNIAPSMNVQDAIELFDSTPAIREMVETGIQEILRETSPITHGISRAFNLIDGYEPEQLHRPLSYNSTWFGLELDQVDPEALANRVSIGVSTSRTIPMNTLTPNNVLPIYPRLTHTAQFFQIRTDELSVDIPFTRSTMTYSRPSLFEVSNSDTFQAHSVASIDTFLSTQGNIMAGSVLEQTIDAQSIGWQSNPVYKQLYRVNQYEPNLTANSSATNTPLYPDSAPWLVSANFIKAENYSILRQNNTNVRSDQLEDRYVFSWEVHSEETDTEFNASNLTGKTYGVIRYGLRLGQSDPVAQLTAETLQWEVLSASQIRSTQPDTHFRSLRLSRNTNHATSGSTELAPATTFHAYTTTQTVRAQAQTGTTTSQNRGLITLDGGTRPTVGHASNNGSHFSLVINKPDVAVADRGFIVASELSSGPGAFNEVHYMLQGNTMGLSAEDTRLSSLNQSSLILSNSVGGCTAELTVKHFSISHDVADNLISVPVVQTEPVAVSSSCEIEGSKITVQFADIMGQALTLKGFFANAETSSNPGNLINLLWLQNDNLGLVFAAREQILQPGFPNQAINN